MQTDGIIMVLLITVLYRLRFLETTQYWRRLTLTLPLIV